MTSIGFLDIYVEERSSVATEALVEQYGNMREFFQSSRLVWYQQAESQ